MKKTLMLICTITFSVTSLWAGDKIRTVEIKTTIQCDHCKICPSCGARLQKELYNQKGIKRVDVDDQKKIIKVAYNTQKTSIESIRHTIASSGYDADDVKASPEAIARLDACCRGEE